MFQAQIKIVSMFCWYIANSSIHPHVAGGLHKKSLLKVYILLINNIFRPLRITKGKKTISDFRLASVITIDKASHPFCIKALLHMDTYYRFSQFMQFYIYMGKHAKKNLLESAKCL